MLYSAASVVCGGWMGAPPGTLSRTQEVSGFTKRNCLSAHYHKGSLLHTPMTSHDDDFLADVLSEAWSDDFDLDDALGQNNTYDLLDGLVDNDLLDGLAHDEHKPFNDGQSAAAGISPTPPDSPERESTPPSPLLVTQFIACGIKYDTTDCATVSRQFQ